MIAFRPHALGSSHLVDQTEMGVLVLAVSVFLLATSVFRFQRRRARWVERERFDRYTSDDASLLPVSASDGTKVEPLRVRTEGASSSTVPLGDDDDQFKIRARAGVMLLLDDDTPCTLVEGTLLKCNFPGFALVPNGSGRSSVAIEGGRPFFIVARRPAPPEVPPTDGPFRSAEVHALALEPIGDRYDCHVEAARRKGRIPRWIPRHDPSRPRYRPWLYPGIAIALMALGWWLLEPVVLLVLLVSLGIALLVSIESITWVLSNGDE